MARRVGVYASLGLLATLQLAAGSYDRERVSTSTGRRDYRLYVPSNLGEEPVPLLMFFHGWTNTCDKLDGGCKSADCDFKAEADKRGFVFVSMCGTGNSWNAGACCPPANSDEKEVDDVEFAKAVLAKVNESLRE